jgi:hypothetical protein
MGCLHEIRKIITPLKNTHSWTLFELDESRPRSDDLFLWESIVFLLLDHLCPEVPAYLFTGISSQISDEYLILHACYMLTLSASFNNLNV